MRNALGDGHISRNAGTIPSGRSLNADSSDPQRLLPEPLDGMISFIVPAHNEENWIGHCLDGIRGAMESVGGEYEVIVVDDASDDATGAIARERGVRLLHVELRNIAAVRNTGAREALGEVLFFVDADTRVNGAAVSAGLLALREGAVGGGCIPALDGRVPLWARWVHAAACFAGRRIRLVGGCCLFCARDAYASCGGFPEELFAGEDIAFVKALKRLGYFVVPAPVVHTSARKLSVAGPWDVISLLCKIAIRGPRYDSAWVRDLLYGGRARLSRRADRIDPRSREKAGGA